jgi:hypothetical protein
MELEVHMATVPTWVQKENDQKSKAAREAELAAARRADAANFIRKRGPGYWDQFATSLEFNALALEKLEGEELHGSVSKSVTGNEHNLHVRVERRSVKHGPELRWLNLWYIPGNGFMRCYYMDQMQPNVEFAVSGKPELGQDILALFDGKMLNADDLGEDIIRQMAGQARAKQRR